MSTFAQMLADNPFAKDVWQGLQQTPKKLSSRYFYDEAGDQLFQRIMQMPAYYLTNCEYEIFTTHRQAILDLLGDAPFDLIELGAGDGYKTKVLLKHFLAAGATFRYLPIDISANALQKLEAELRAELPNLQVEGLAGDYFKMLEQLGGSGNVRKFILFIGANIGNLSCEQAAIFLQRIQQSMNPGDLLLIGFDLKKDPQLILDAYNDPEGITAAFNLNLLHRINRELGADFNVDAFSHWETYNPVSGATKSYLVSRAAQHVHLFGQRIAFDAWEAIEVELSLKYSLPDIEALASAAGFRIRQHFTDRHNFFIDTIWQK